ncbi:MAG: peptide chain release factor N(5)-glutamine methyltransferase [Actinomycetota bacterium]|nr:peptide chain release factor N(5)-glutamine methyltransferase [Actinomycetota bacterium]
MIAERTFTVFEILKWATLELEGGSVLSPDVEAERIVGDTVGLSRADLYLNKERILCEAEVKLIEEAVKERLTGRPLQYILGCSQFRYLGLVCREGVLIPRPETELLVDEALAELKSLGGPRNVLDLGCGTGAIALSIAHEYPKANVYASDVSSQALELTRENAVLNGLAGKIQIIESSLFEALGNLVGQLDMIISNPPYIPSNELKNLQREVQFEPALALDGGRDGLKFYRLIANQSPEFLKPGGVLLLEVGVNQAASVANMLKSTGCFNSIEITKDYQGIERIVKARRK